MAKKLNVYRRIALRAKKLNTSNGYGAHPPPKIGWPIKIIVIEKIQQFYLAENIVKHCWAEVILKMSAKMANGFTWNL